MTLHQINNTIQLISQELGKMDQDIMGLIATQILEEHYNQISEFCTAVKGLHQGKLPHNLIPKTSLATAMNKLVTEAETKGLKIGLHSFNNIYQLQLSYLYKPEDQVIIALLHIPLYKEKQILQLHKIIPTPMPIGINETLFFLQFKPEHQFLAHNENRTLLQSFTQLELNN